LYITHALLYKFTKEGLEEDDSDFEETISKKSEALFGKKK
jgi:hypothetical protein